MHTSLICSTSKVNTGLFYTPNRCLTCVVDVPHCTAYASTHIYCMYMISKMICLEYAS